MPEGTGQGSVRSDQFRALVVDDSPAIRRRVVEKLESRGFEIIEASSAEEALDLTLQHTFDLVVSDIEMEAITGVQLCRVFRGDPAMADIAFVLLTAAKEIQTRFWGRKAGADVYLGKEDMDVVLGVGCPNILYPYLREVVSDSASRAGFMPVVLAPMNFEALYMQRLQQQQQQQQQPTAPAGNA